MPAHLFKNNILFLALALAAAGVGGFLAVRTTAPAAGEEQVKFSPNQADQANAADEKAIRDVQAAYVKAFNAGNAKAVAAFWAIDGEFIDADGKIFRGRPAIEKEFAAFFKETKGVSLEISTDSLRFVSPTVALESGSTRVTQGAEGAANHAAYTIVHTKKDGQWQLANVREMPYAPASNYDHLRDLEWLVGNWTATMHGHTLQLSCEWTAKRNFLLRKYTVKGADDATKTGVQIIGWDPQNGSIRSWVFDSDGGFGSEQWTKDGKRYVLEAHAVTRDGAAAEAVNVLTRIDHDSFTWQSAKRAVNQVALPNTDPITVTRVKTKK